MRRASHTGGGVAEQRVNLAGVATTGADVRDETIGDLSRPLPASSEASRRGAYLAALVLLALREDPATRDGLAGAYLAYGPYGQSLTPSCRDYGDRNLVTSTQAEEWFRARAVPPPDWTPSSADDPAISPLYAVLTGLPPARFVVGTNDPLLDDTLFMAARWRAAGNLAELDVVDAACHAFTVFPLTVARRDKSGSTRSSVNE
ncbi:MAG: alpha/beta hydrolase fold domain-containing protein [Nocardioidaceae bacterium]